MKEPIFLTEDFDFEGEDDEYTRKSSSDIRWNDDPEWIKYVATFDKVIKEIATKYTNDVHLREDCEQEARIILLHKFPYQCKAYPLYKEGIITKEMFEKALDIYLRQTIKFTILVVLKSPRTGSWYSGRTTVRPNSTTGKKERVYTQAKIASLDQLINDYGMDIDDKGSVTWPSINSADGLYYGNWRTDNGYGRIE